MNIYKLIKLLNLNKSTFVYKELDTSIHKIRITETYTSLSVLIVQKYTEQQLFKIASNEYYPQKHYIKIADCINMDKQGNGLGSIAMTIFLYKCKEKGIRFINGDIVSQDYLHFTRNLVLNYN